MFLPLHVADRYRCPDEPGEISHSVHLARLAAGFAKCQQCPHRGGEFGGELELRPQTRSAKSLLIRTAAGVRGVYLNQLGRPEATQWAMALANALWDELPPIVLTFDETRLSESARKPSMPVIVVGHDERPAAPDVLAGAILGLTRMSCRVVDIGVTTEACLRFSVQHLRADAGLMITGAGCDVSRIGFDVIRQFGLPPEPCFLDNWCAQHAASPSRRSRSSGQSGAWSPGAEYDTQLWKHFHALRPLRVVCGSSSQQVLLRLERLFARLPGRLATIKLPTRVRNLVEPDDDDVQRVCQLVQQDGAQLGLVIDEDGAGCALFDERGQLVPERRWQQLVVEHLLHDEPNRKIVLAASAWDGLAAQITANNGIPLLVAEADRAPRLLAERAAAAIGSDHRFWLDGELPICDAIVTLAVVMQLLSRSDAEFSQRMAHG